MSAHNLSVALRVLETQIRVQQKLHDRFYETCREKGFLNDDPLRNSLMGYQHDVSAGLYAALASVENARKESRRA